MVLDNGTMAMYAYFLHLLILPCMLMPTSSVNKL